jgi:uncharacterized OB-fold protein
VDIPRNWRLNKQRYLLTGEVCPHCAVKIFPPRDICPDCGKETEDNFAFSGRGEVFSYTTIYNPTPENEFGTSYTDALVKLEEGPIVRAQLTNLGDNEVQIGMPVERVTSWPISSDHERGRLDNGYRFKPRVCETAA